MGRKAKSPGGDLLPIASRQGGRRLFLANYLHPAYIKKQLVLTLSLGDPPEKIAMGVAVGAFLGVFPTFYFGIPLAAIGARLFKFNMASAIAGSAISSPLTSPFIIVASAALGGALTGADWMVIAAQYQELIKDLSATFKGGLDLGPLAALLRKQEFWLTVKTTVLAYLAGNIILCVLTAVPAYFVTKHVVIGYRRKRGALV